MTSKKGLSDVTDRELMEKMVDNTRKASDTLIKIKNFIILLIGLFVMAFAFVLVYMQHD
ncbi:MAG TPA: hypothetical protein VIS49_04030 [Cyclobacteriaceae bacterium]